MKPALLEPGGAEVSVETAPVRRQELVDRNLFHHRVPRAVRDAKLPRCALGQRPARAEARRVAHPCRLYRRLSRLDDVGVLEVVRVVRRDGVRTRDPTRAGREERGEVACALAAAFGAVMAVRGRVEGDHEEAAKRFDGADVGRRLAPRPRVTADIGLHRALDDERRSGRRIHRVETDFLRVVGRIEGQLVPGEGAVGETEGRGDDGRGEKNWGRGARTAAPPPRVGPQDQAETFGQVLSIQVYVEVGSPLGQPGGAVILRMGIVIMRFGSRIWNS